MKAEGQVEVLVRCSMEQRVVGRFNLNRDTERIGPCALDWAMFTRSFVPDEQAYRMTGQPPKRGDYVRCSKCNGKLEIVCNEIVSVGKLEGTPPTKNLTRDEARANALKEAQQANVKDAARGRRRFSEKDAGYEGVHRNIQSQPSDGTTAVILLGVTMVEVK